METIKGLLVNRTIDHQIELTLVNERGENVHYILNLPQALDLSAKLTNCFWRYFQLVPVL